MNTKYNSVLCIIETPIEAAQEGVVNLVGSDFGNLFSETQRLLDDNHTTSRIVRVLKDYIFL